jgi:hemerythrin
MPWFTWTDEFLTGTADIDEQHRRLVGLIQDFYDALAGRAARSHDALARLLAGLVQYTRYHFSTEERYMSGYDYPDREGHVAEHAGFIAKVQDIHARFDQGEMVLSLTVTTFLRDWLSQHILGADQRLGRFLADRRRR